MPFSLSGARGVAPLRRHQQGNSYQKTGLSGPQLVEWTQFQRDAHAFIFSGVCLTKDEHRAHDPEQPFPDYPYLRCLLDCLLVSGRLKSPERAHYALDWGLPLEHLQAMHYQGLIFVEKSRQIMASWLCVAYLLWRAKFHPHQLLIVQSKKEDDAAKFVFQKEAQQARMSFMESRLPEWLQDHLFHKSTVSLGFQAMARNGSRADYGNLYFPNGSHVWAVPQGGDIVRSNTPSCLFADEAAFQPDFGLAYQACLPAIVGGGQLIVVSSAEVSDFSTLVEAKI